MDIPITIKPVTDLRVYLAEERTFLAWIRTGIALMAFGFVVARFGIFADERYPIQLSLWLGAALVAIGVTMNLFSLWRYIWLIGELNRGEVGPRSVSKQGVIVALCLALLGIVMSIYMILIVAQPPNTQRAHLASMPADIQERG